MVTTMDDNPIKFTSLHMVFKALHNMASNSLPAPLPAPLPTGAVVAQLSSPGALNGSSHASPSVPELPGLPPPPTVMGTPFP